jgi:hypothetical protein
VRSRWLALLFVALACNEAPPDRREWRATDHDHTDTPNANQVVGGPDGGTSPELARYGLNELIIVAWQQNCVRCHGQLGRGDGPQGPMTHAIDLSDPDFQRRMTDDQILASLKSGKGLMPASPLPESTLKGLVQVVRLIGKATAEAAAAGSGVPAASGAPHGSAAPSGSGRPAPSARPAASPARPPAAPSAGAAATSRPASGSAAPPSAAP